MSMVVKRQTCRACGNPHLAHVLDLGSQRIAGAFGPDAPKRRIPLELVRCDTDASETACGLVQLRHTVPPDVLYRSYWYRSGVNGTMTENLHGIARQVEQLARVRTSQTVIDVGCNDGTLLDGYENRTLRFVGYDPSDQVRYAWEKGYGNAVQKPFGPDTGYLAQAITSIAMFYDLDDPRQFIKDVHRCLLPDGIWALELHYLPAMLEANGFDAVVHEHLCYYSLHVIERLLAEEQMMVLDAVENGINGGSIRVFACHRSAAGRQTAEQKDRLRALRLREFEMGLDTSEPYERFAERVFKAGNDLRHQCERIRQGGDVIHAYGASTKGNVILQYAGLGPDLIAAAADRNPDKWGTETITGIPVISEDQSRQARPDYYLMLPWHFADEFVAREHEFLDRGGRFIVPLPTVRLIGHD